MDTYQAQLEDFTTDNIPTLDIAVKAALERLITEESLSTIDISKYSRPLVVGSGNAAAAGRILFANTTAVFATESTVDEKLERIDDIDEVVLISASGSKHAPIIARKARDAGKHVTLITTTVNSAVEKTLSSDELATHVFPRNREPYTYNTSTYMSMFQGAQREDAAAIKQFIEEEIGALDLPDFSKHDKFFLIVPPQFEGIADMVKIKFIELFGRHIARDIETSEYINHATTVVPSDELFISFGVDNQTWGNLDKRLHIPLPESASNVAVMAVTYYIVGQIQKAHPSYFSDNIVQYCSYASTVFGEDIQPIIEGN